MPVRPKYRFPNNLGPNLHACEHTCSECASKVVYRPSKILSEDEYLVKVWLVQLQGIESGNLRWDAT